MQLDKQFVLEELKKAGQSEQVQKAEQDQAVLDRFAKLGVFPVAICLALKTVDPAYFGPLQTTTVGTLVTTLAVLLWLAALATARKIIKVEI